MTTLSGYAFSTLRESEPVLYRGTRDGVDPILLVAPVAEDPSSTARLEHEYRSEEHTSELQSLV